MFKLSTAHLIFHLLCYNTSWFAGILLVAHQQLLMAHVCVSLIIMLQWCWQAFVMQRTQHLLWLTVIMLLVSTCLDSFCIGMSWLLFTAQPFTLLTPPWMMLMWVEFAVLFYGVLYHWRLRYKTIAVLSWLGFTLAYFAGVKLGAATIVHPYGAFYWGMVWGLGLPFILWQFNRIVGD